MILEPSMHAIINFGVEIESRKGLRHEQQEPALRGS
jgi:hypothetical protein